jgi:Skp family chaperone for outer membrane proteins
MRVLLAAAVLSMMLMTAPTSAQTPAPPAPAPQGQQPAPKPTPATPPAQTAPAPAPRPFPEGAKVAYIDIQRIANLSAEGKAATAKVQGFVQKKQAEAAERQKALQADQQKLQSGGSVLSDSARAELEKKIERTNVELQRMAQDAQQEVQDLQQQLQADFQRKLMPIVQQVSEEKGIHLLFSAGDSGIVWADTGLDITADVIKRFDAGGAPAPKPPMN